jgi:hypothetical protein
MAKYLADRTRELGAEQITEELLWEIIESDTYLDYEWVATESVSEAVVRINTLLRGAAPLEDLVVPISQARVDSSPDVGEELPSAARRRRGARPKTPPKDRSELLTKLTEGVANLADSDEWKRALEFQSRFHHYSPQNVSLVLYQDPDATMVAGYETWKKQGRFVKKGEAGISILAPNRFKTTDEETGEETFAIRGFHWASVFDVRQTDGEEIPNVVKKLSGEDSNNLYDQLQDYATSIGFSVSDHDFGGSGVNGDCNHTAREIRVETTNSGNQRVKTLAHELAHANLHADYQDRGLAELEAESTAFVVCNAMGIDSGDYSFGYVTGWSGGGEEAIESIKSSRTRIQKTAEGILDHCEHLMKLEIEHDISRGVAADERTLVVANTAEVELSGPLAAAHPSASEKLIIAEQHEKNARDYGARAQRTRDLLSQQPDAPGARKWARSVKADLKRATEATELARRNWIMATHGIERWTAVPPSLRDTPIVTTPTTSDTAVEQFVPTLDQREATVNKLELYVRRAAAEPPEIFAQHPVRDEMLRLRDELDSKPTADADEIEQALAGCQRKLDILTTDIEELDAFGLIGREHLCSSARTEHILDAVRLESEKAALSLYRKSVLDSLDATPQPWQVSVRERFGDDGLVRTAEFRERHEIADATSPFGDALSEEQENELLLLRGHLAPSPSSRPMTRSL